MSREVTVIPISLPLQPRRWEDKKDALWTVYQRLQENLIKGGLSGRNAKGKQARTRSVKMVLMAISN
ncbi:hypothetical protein HMPREF3129_10120 [Proteus sp. HMSC14B05]|nr:hypothetical protein NX82_01350 [Proteus mirabilis]OFV17519.1 hypothetical protein HMPREF3129_10120 [Proteus sp. HMSC14B05]